MANLFEYIEQNKKEYPFRIKIAQPLGEDLPDKFSERLEKQLEQYGVVSCSAPKKTMAQAMPYDFHRKSASTEVYVIDCVLQYPTTNHVLKQNLVDHLMINPSNIAVKHPDEPLEEYQKEHEENKEYVLAQDRNVYAQPANKLYGDEYNLEFLKSLREKKQKQEFAAKVPEAADTTPQQGNMKSAIGS